MSYGERIYVVVSLKANRATPHPTPPSHTHANTHTPAHPRQQGACWTAAVRDTHAQIRTSVEISPSLSLHSNGLLQRAAMVLQAGARRLLRMAGRWDDEEANSKEANRRWPQPVDHVVILAGIFLIL